MLKIPDVVKKELDGLIVPWEIKPGARHHKIFVNGKFCAILPMGRPTQRAPRADLNIRSQIRRAAAA